MVPPVDDHTGAHRRDGEHVIRDRAGDREGRSRNRSGDRGRLRRSAGRRERHLAVREVGVGLLAHQRFARAVIDHPEIAAGHQLGLETGNDLHAGEGEIGRLETLLRAHHEAIGCACTERVRDRGRAVRIERTAHPSETSNEQRGAGNQTAGASIVAEQRVLACAIARHARSGLRINLGLEAAGHL
jgi:hypothetical protein